MAFTEKAESIDSSANELVPRGETFMLITQAANVSTEDLAKLYSTYESNPLSLAEVLTIAVMDPDVNDEEAIVFMQYFVNLLREESVSRRDEEQNRVRRVFQDGIFGMFMTSRIDEKRKTYFTSKLSDTILPERLKRYYDRLEAAEQSIL